MDELTPEKTKRLKRHFGYASKNAANSGLQKVSPYVHRALTFMLFLSSGHISAEKIRNFSDPTSKTELNTLSFDNSVSPDVAKTVDFYLNSTANLAVFSTLEECISQNGKDFTLDISNIEFSMDDLALAKGKESATAKKMWQKAVSNRTGIGRCTRSVKQVLSAMGWVKNLAQEDRRNFESIVPAWKLIPLLDAGKIGPLMPININPDELKSKTTPIPLVRVNEQGETKNSHAQFMGNKGAAYGLGVSSSPECHKERGKVQWYGKAHFYGDRETVMTVVNEVSKSRDDMLLVFDKESKTVTMVELNNVPQEYQLAITQHRVKEGSPMKDLEKTLPPEVSTPTVADNQTPGKPFPLKTAQFLMKNVKNGGLSNS